MYLKPSYFIIGERKCGTSSLFRYLVKHPNVLPGILKEPNFFGKGSNFVQQHIDKYWSLFPSIENNGDLYFEWPELNSEGLLYHEEVRVPRNTDIQHITGEASANTFFEVEPELVYRYQPDIKLILLIREPVERAFSHHRMYHRFMEEARGGFDVTDFATDVRNEMHTIAKGGTGEFLAPGIYLNRLKKWLAVFPDNQLKVFTLGELERDPQSVMNQITAYLGIPAHDYGDFLRKRFNQAPAASIESEIREELLQFYAPHNQALAHFIGRELKW